MVGGDDGRLSAVPLVHQLEEGIDLMSHAKIITYNQGRCCYTLPFVPVGPEDKCQDGQWLHKGKLQNLYGICYCGLPHSFVRDIEDLKCSECIFYDSSKEECHFHRQNVYKSGPNDWCNNGEWLYQTNDDEAIRVSIGFCFTQN